MTWRHELEDAYREQPGDLEELLWQRDGRHTPAQDLFAFGVGFAQDDYTAGLRARVAELERELDRAHAVIDELRSRIHAMAMPDGGTFD